MKKLILKGLLCALIALMFLTALAFLTGPTEHGNEFNLLTDSSKYRFFGWAEADAYYQDAARNPESNTLIIGDSVCAQLLSHVDDETGDILVCGNNQAMTMAWEYFCVERFIDTHPNAERVYLYITYSTLDYEYNATYSYQYVVHPMVRYGLYDRLDDASKNKLESIFGKAFVNSKMCNFIGDSGMNRKIYLNAVQTLDSWGQSLGIRKEDEYGLSDVVRYYIPKINDMCVSRGVEFAMIATPVPDRESDLRNIEILKADYMDSELGMLFPDYFESIVYYPADLFKDKEHFKDELLTDEFRSEVLTQSFEANGVSEEFGGLTTNQ